MVLKGKIVMFDFIKNFLKDCFSDTTLENNYLYVNLWDDYYGLNLIPFLPLHDTNVPPISIGDLAKIVEGKDNESTRLWTNLTIERLRDNGWDIYENDQEFSLGHKHYYKNVVVEERNKQFCLVERKKRRMKFVNAK